MAASATASLGELWLKLYLSLVEQVFVIGRNCICHWLNLYLSLVETVFVIGWTCIKFVIGWKWIHHFSFVFLCFRYENRCIIDLKRICHCHWKCVFIDVQGDAWRFPLDNSQRPKTEEEICRERTSPPQKKLIFVLYSLLFLLNVSTFDLNVPDKCEPAAKIWQICKFKQIINSFGDVP